MFDVSGLLRENIRGLKAYSSARNEFVGLASVYLDANENPFSEYGRYPDPLQKDLRNRISEYKEVSAKQICLGNGSDELIDLSIRAFCEPGRDNIIVLEPGYGMYRVCADINNVDVKSVLLEDEFQLNAEKCFGEVDANTKMIFVCTPNNPSGNCFEKAEIESLLNGFKGIVFVDEAYADFSDKASWIECLNEFPNLMVSQTFSKAWGLAEIRLGVQYASAEIISVIDSIKPPYNVNGLSQKMALEKLENTDTLEKWISIIKEERNYLMEEFSKMKFVEKVFTSDANYLLVRVQDANSVYNFLKTKGIIVRNRSNQPLCENCLRFTIGTPQENQILLNQLKTYANEN